MRTIGIILVTIPLALSGQWADHDQYLNVDFGGGGMGPSVEQIRHGSGATTTALNTYLGLAQLIRTDANGTVLWRKGYEQSGGTQAPWAGDVVPLPGEGVAWLHGMSFAPTGFHVVRTDSTGEIVSAHWYSFTPADTSSASYVPRMLSLPDGSLIVACSRGTAMVVARLEVDGTIGWSTGFRPMEGVLGVRATSIALCPNGDLLAMGSRLYGPTFLARLSSEGTMLWCRRYSPSRYPRRVRGGANPLEPDLAQQCLRPGCTTPKVVHST